MRKDTSTAFIAGAVAGLPFGVYLTALGLAGETSHPGPSFLILLRLVPFVVIVLLATSLFLPIGASLGGCVGLVFVRFVNKFFVPKYFAGFSIYRRVVVFSVILWVFCAIGWRSFIVHMALGVWLFALLIFVFEGFVFANLYTRWMKEPIQT